MSESYESQGERHAESGCMERLRRIHYAVGELLVSGFVVEYSNEMRCEVRRGDSSIELTEFKIPKQTWKIPIQRKVEVTHLLPRQLRIGAHAEPDKPIVLCIEFGAQPEQFRISIEGRFVWEGGKQLIPESHTTTLHLLHSVADILERTRIEMLQCSVQSDLEQRRSQLAALMVMKEHLAESDRPVAG